MKERPILFSGPMVRAVLEGRKTQTRRVIKDPLDKKGGQFCVEYADDDPNILVHVHNPKCGGYCDYACHYPCLYGQTPENIAGILESSFGRSRGAGTSPGVLSVDVSVRLTAFGGNNTSRALDVPVMTWLADRVETVIMAWREKTGTRAGCAEGNV